MYSGEGLRGKHVSDDHSYVAKTHDKESSECPNCNKEVVDSDRALCCCKCKKWKQAACLKMSNNVFNVLSKQSSTMWFCPDDCIKDAEDVFIGPDRLTVLNNKVDLLLKSFSDFKLVQDNQEEIIDRKIEEKVKEVLQEQKEVERRKLNLLIFKAPEAVEEASKVEETHHDLLFMNDVLNEMKIDTTVSNIIRHGKRMKDRARPLQITVPSAEVKTEILKKTKLLRQSEDSNIKKISIRPDRTPKQRKEVKAL